MSAGNSATGRFATFNTDRRNQNSVIGLVCIRRRMAKRRRRETLVYGIFYLIGLIVVVLAIINLAF